MADWGKMSAKTKIVVLHKKEVIYTGIFALLGILLLVLLISMFMPGDSSPEVPETPPFSTPETSPDFSPQPGVTYAPSSRYQPGVYTTEILLGNQSVDLEVTVNQYSVTSINMLNPDEAVTTMYPLLMPTFDYISSQVCEMQTTEGISYTAERKYTSLVLLEAIESILEKASAQ